MPERSVAGLASFPAPGCRQAHDRRAPWAGGWCAVWRV